MKFLKIKYKKYNIYSNHNDHEVIKPKISELEFFVIKTEKELEDLKNNNYEFLLNNIDYINKLLKKRVIVFLFTHKKKIIHENWLALDYITSQFLDRNCYKFMYKNNYHKKKDSDKIAVWGEAQTHKEYRRQNLYQSSLSQIFRFLLVKGYKKHIFSVRVNNDKSLKAVSIFKPIIIAKGYTISIRIFNIQKIIFAKIIST